MDTSDLKKIKESAEVFLQKMTIPASEVEAIISEEENISDDSMDTSAEKRDVVELNIHLNEPQIIIGQGGQTLFELQRIIRMMLNKKLGKIFYLNLDINDYKKKKTEYLKNLAKDLADQVSLTKESKVLVPMPPYERRILHRELSKRTDVLSISQGLGQDRHIMIKAK